MMGGMQEQHPRRYVDYANPYDYPDVEVLLEGTWRPGELTAQRQEDDGTWVGRVQYYAAPEGRAGGWFPADQIRRDTVDRSYGRVTS